MIKPIFSELFLSNYLCNFKLSTIPNIRRTKQLIEDLIKELESGKFQSLKEEEIKSRFVTTFFGDILNFNYGNARTWMLREEKKSITDASKPDAVLGYFYIDKLVDDVRVVIELKDAQTDLDEKQNRATGISPVDQGFSYAHKCGGNCKWVIVTNINEIRFYRSEDSSRCQVYMLSELADENKLSELLFLFHRDRFIKHDLETKSNTDILFELSKVRSKVVSDNLHIIDKIYFSLKRFEEFGFVSPDYLVSIKPFNILDEYVWHYNNGVLFTLNPEIYKLIINISINHEAIIFSDALSEELLGRDIEDVIERLRWSFRFLNRCMITEIHAVRDYNEQLKPERGVIKLPKTHIFPCDDDNIGILNIDLRRDNIECDCLICNYRNFDFDKLIHKLKKTEGSRKHLSMEYAFANFLVSADDYTTPYYMLDTIRNTYKSVPEKGVTYFFATLNSTFLYNCVQMSTIEDTEKIRSDIRSIDIDKVLYNELEFYVEKEVLNYLRKIKNDDLIIKVQDNVEDLMAQVHELQRLICNGGSQTGPNYAYNLLVNYEKCFKHHYGNSIFYVKFDRYKKISEKILRALIISYNTSGYGIDSFNDFILTESILNISSSKLQKIFSEQEIIAVDGQSIAKLLKKLGNFLNSYIKIGFFNDYVKNDVVAIQLENWDFERQYSTIFSNIFTILSRVEISREQFNPLITHLIGFLAIEDKLAHFDLKEMENFILKRGDLFEMTDLESILNTAIRRDERESNKYDGLIQIIPKSFLKHKPQYKYSNINLVRKLLLNCEREDGTFKNYRKTVNLAQIANEKCFKILHSSYTEFLDTEFDGEFYERLLRTEVLKFNEGNYFEKYIAYVNKSKNFRPFKLANVNPISLTYLNFILAISKMKIDPYLSFFDNLEELNTFERWLLNPKKFDYELFDSDWLIWMAKYSNFLKRLANIPEVLDAVEKRLEQKFDSSIARIKYEYLVVSSIDQ